MRHDRVSPGDDRGVLDEASVGGLVVGRHAVNSEAKREKRRDIRLVLRAGERDVDPAPWITAQAVGIPERDVADEDASRKREGGHRREYRSQPSPRATRIAARHQARSAAPPNAGRTARRRGSIARGDDHPAPSSDRGRNVVEAAPHFGQGITDAHRWTWLHLAREEPVLGELLQARRQHAVSNRREARAELAEAEGPLLQDRDDEPVPRLREDVHGGQVRRAEGGVVFHGDSVWGPAGGIEGAIWCNFLFGSSIRLGRQEA